MLSKGVPGTWKVHKGSTLLSLLKTLGELWRWISWMDFHLILSSALTGQNQSALETTRQQVSSLLTNFQQLGTEFLVIGIVSPVWMQAHNWATAYQDVRNKNIGPEGKAQLQEQHNHSYKQKDLSFLNVSWKSTASINILLFVLNLQNKKFCTAVPSNSCFNQYIQRNCLE